MYSEENSTVRVWKRKIATRNSELSRLQQFQKYILDFRNFAAGSVRTS